MPNDPTRVEIITKAACICGHLLSLSLLKHCPRRDSERHKIVTRSLSYLTVDPDEEAINQLLRSWAWKLPGRWRPVIFSILGDAFLEDESGNVWWLDTGYEELKHVAADKRSFIVALGTEASESWLLSQLVEQLRANGKIPVEGQCYSFAVFPVFFEGSCTIENIFVMSAKEYFAWSADLHNQIHDLPDGTNVWMVVATPRHS